MARDEATLSTLAQRARPLAVLVSVRGPRAQPAMLRLQQGSCRIGAGSAADIVIEDSRVSRAHVELTLVPEGVEVRDLGSRNGTFFQNQRVNHMVLGLGSSIRIGSAEITLSADSADLTPADHGDEDHYGELIGTSAPMRRLFATLRRLEGSLVTVLVSGASGAGKELVARALHQGSALRDAPLVIVNCATLTGDLVRSELFGHKKGAFTGAGEDHVGAFEAADGGTLFLDEVGELPLDVQPMLLRALEAGEVVRVGEHTSRRVKVRLIAATNIDLRQRVNERVFREDLFFRLAVITLAVPSLDERPQDVTPLAQHFARRLGGNELPQEVVTALSARPWRGNVRELRNAVQAYLVLGHLPDTPQQQVGALDHLFRQLVDLDRPYQQQKQTITDRFSRIFFEVALEQAGGNRSEVARRLGLDRSYLGKLLTKHGL